MPNDPHLTREQLILQGDGIADVNESRIAQQVYTQMHNDDLIEDILNAVKSIKACPVKSTAIACTDCFNKLFSAYNKYDNWLSQQETQ